MVNFNYWKHRNLEIIKYGEDKTAIQAGPAEERQALSDWDRLAKAGEKCTYFINGKKLSSMQPKGFESVGELRSFLKDNLFPHAENADALATSAIAHFHQAGLPHATNFSIKNISTSNPNIKVGDPETIINFEASSDGLVIKEKNTYKNWQDTSHGKPIKHECSGSKEFYAQTETSYLLTENDEIKLTDLEINCPSRHLAPIFDERPKEEQTIRFPAGEILKNMVAYLIEKIWSKPSLEDTPPEPRGLGQ